MSRPVGASTEVQERANAAKALAEDVGKKRKKAKKEWVNEFFKIMDENTGGLPSSSKSLMDKFFFPTSFLCHQMA